MLHLIDCVNKTRFFHYVQLSEKEILAGGGGGGFILIREP